MSSAELLAVGADLDPSLDETRREVRSFLRAEIESGGFEPRCDAWHTGWDEGFSQRLASRGWVGMTIPPEYGGAGRTTLDRYVVAEELLAAGAPVAAHWAADRQIAPSLLKFGTEAQRRQFLPGIASGELSFALGMSEPDSGSDLASIRTTASRAPGGWSVNGTKLWVTGAHHAYALLCLVRTDPVDPSARHAGISQLLIPTESDGVTVRPIVSLAGEHHFNEVVLEDVFVPDSMLLGQLGEGWQQVTSELAFERGGPERFLSTYPLLEHLVTSGAGARDPRIGGLLSRLWALRQLGLSVAAQLSRGEAADTAAALIKELGTRFESEVIDVAARILDVEPDLNSTDRGAQLLAQATLQSPGFTIRGGTTEILRGMIARGVGLR